MFEGCVSVTWKVSNLFFGEMTAAFRTQCSRVNSADSRSVRRKIGQLC